MQKPKLVGWKSSSWVVGVWLVHRGAWVMRCDQSCTSTFCKKKQKRNLDQAKFFPKSQTGSPWDAQ